MAENNIFKLTGKSTIVTGAGKGIGAVLASGLAKMGARVYALDLCFPEHDGMIDQLVCDVTVKNDFKSICEKIFNDFGQIDILINNAGVSFPFSASEYPSEAWDKTILVNLTATFQCSQIVADFMKKKETGSIINITSLSAELGFPNNPAYAASKGGGSIMSAQVI
ncbi:MAG: SDR family oxidoreductase [Candidatus Levybacteria bacterium]|nr:SDR family oxidoreductase [Candidatus Levybacteria bacterium]